MSDFARNQFTFPHRDFLPSTSANWLKSGAAGPVTEITARTHDASQWNQFRAKLNVFAHWS